MTARICSVIVLSSSYLFPAAVWAQLPDARSERREFLVNTFARYAISADEAGGETVSLNRKPLHYFANPISGVVEAGVFVWEQDGYPLAVGKVFINEKKKAWGDYISSLSATRMQMKKSDDMLWRPSATKFKTLEDSSIPSSVSSARRAQMRAIARQFRVFDLWKEDGLINNEVGTDWSLRMLAKPLLRYASKQRNVLDGGVFAFVLGTNPEAILTIEAIDDGNSSYWRYRFSRLTIYQLRAKRKGKLVWSVPRMLADEMPINMTSYHGWHYFDAYPSR